MNHNEKQHLKVEIAYPEKRGESVDVADNHKKRRFLCD